MRIKAALLFGLLSLQAHAHKSGFHKKAQVSIRPGNVEALVSMDVDSGPRCALLRQAADANLDGQLSAEETKALKERLVKTALRSFRVSVSGFELKGGPLDSKIDLRGDFGGGTTGLSVAVLWKADLPRKVSEGMVLEVQDAAPDGSHVRVEVQQVSKEGTLLAPLTVQEVQRAGQVKVRLLGHF